jgi:AcrR family transcriptional regulator
MTVAPDNPDMPSARLRRTTVQVRDALIDVAASVFAAKGYAGASTREIARGARTSETTIYRQFGSKADLFSAAVVEPFYTFLTDYEAFFDEALATATWTDYMITHQCVRQLYRRLHANRNAVLALIAAHGDPESQLASREAVRRFDEFFDRLEKMGIERWSRGAGGFDVSRLKFVHRFLVGLVLSVSTLDPWFVPGGWNKPSEEQLVAELTKFIMTGVFGSLPTDVAEQSRTLRSFQ